MTLRPDIVRNLRLAFIDMSGTSFEDNGIMERAFTRTLEKLGIAADSPRFTGMLGFVRDTLGQSKVRVFQHLFEDEPAVAAEAPKAAPAPAAVAAGPSTETILKMYADRETTEVALDGMRRTIAARLTEAKQTIPHFYLRRSAKLDALMEFRAMLNKQLDSRGVKLSVNDFIIKACALALQEVPDANAVWAGDRIIKLKPSDVAVAVAIEGGLFTPVLKDADKQLGAPQHPRSNPGWHA